MAEGFARFLKSDFINAYSAGTAPKGLDPRAIKVMAEVGIDITQQRSKHLDEFNNTEFDYVITLCDHAHESCPLFPGKTKVIRVGFDDPPRLAAITASEEEILNHYRRVRDEIKQFILMFSNKP